MTKTLVKATLYRPTPPGDVPANGYIEARPSLRRDLGDEAVDAVILPAKFTSRLGAALTYTDNDDDEQTAPATPGVAWFWIDATDAAPYANLWYWTFTERTDGGTRRYCTVPTSAVVVEYDDLPDIDPDSYDPATPPGPAWAAALAAAVATLNAAIAAVEAGDVDSVAGLSGTVTASGLKTALNLPADTANAILDEIASRIADVELARDDIAAEVVDRTNADTALHATITSETGAAITTAINSLLDGAPGALDTLNELAAAVNDDASFAASVTTALAGKVPTSRTVNGHALSADVTVSKSDVGLGSVDNTADADKPVSTAGSTALAGKQPLATMLTKLAALASTLTEGQLIRWDATLGEPVAVNPVGASRIAASVNGTGVATSLPPGAAGGSGAIQTIANTAISVTNSSGRNVVIRFGASFNQTVAGTGGVFFYLRETTSGNAADRKICVQPLTGSATSGNTFVTATDEFDIGVVTTTRTFELRASLFTPSGQTPTATVYNSSTSPTWIRADAA